MSVSIFVVKAGSKQHHIISLKHLLKKLLYFPYPKFNLTQRSLQRNVLHCALFDQTWILSKTCHVCLNLPNRPLIFKTWKFL